MGRERDKLIKNIRQLISSGNLQEAKEILSKMHPADIAEIVNEANSNYLDHLLGDLGREKFSEVLIELDEDVREKVLEKKSSKEIAKEVNKLDTDDAADIINELSEDIKEDVISQIENVEHAKDIIDLLRYDEGTAGSLMEKELIKVNENWKMLTCVKEMRKQAQKTQKVLSVYVVNDSGILIGTLSLKTLLTTSTKTPIRDVQNKNIHYVSVSEKAEKVAYIMQKYDLFVIPVVDEIGVLAGRITIDDVVDFIRDEADKDYQLASGISKDIETRDGIYELTKARLPWLLIGLLGGILGAQVIGIFNIESHIELAFFTPLITAMGGNVGIQSSAIIVQGLAGNTIRLENASIIFIKEIGVALTNGIICSILAFAFCYFTYGTMLAVTISVSLIIVIIFAALFGAFVPLTLNKYKIDPALATGPFITTMNDILGLLIYFIIGRMILNF